MKAANVAFSLLVYNCASDTSLRRCRQNYYYCGCCYLIFIVHTVQDEPFHSRCLISSRSLKTGLQEGGKKPQPAGARRTPVGTAIRWLPGSGGVRQLGVLQAWEPTCCLEGSRPNCRTGIIELKRFSVINDFWTPHCFTNA